MTNKEEEQEEEAKTVEKSSFVELSENDKIYILKHIINSRNVENTRLRLVFSTFPSCSKISVVFYHSVTHGLGLFIC